MSAADLGVSLLRGLLERTAIPTEQVDEVILGNCYPTMEAPAIGRVVALDAGLPVTVAGYQLDRRCGSGLQAIINACQSIEQGAAELIIAGGVESMSQAPFYSTSIRWGTRSGELPLHDSLTRGRVTAGGAAHLVRGGMLETAENLRREFAISREEQDELAVASHRRAFKAQASGVFAEEIIPVEVANRVGRPTVVSSDEHIRPDATLETLASLSPVLLGMDPDATVTAGNASGQNDAAAMCIVTTPRRADALGLDTFGYIRAWAVAGVEPSRMGIGPVSATEKALDRAGLALGDLELIELNEAFASQVLACTREWNFRGTDFERLNVHGSGISLGHPVGATGARIMTTLLREMRRRGARYGLETMCIGGGQGLAAVIEAREP
jgi:acetyl-CoA C-acetyltransferase